MAAPSEFEYTSGTGEPSRLQPLVDMLFLHGGEETQLNCLLLAETHDLDEELMEVVNLLPPGSYTRAKMCDQFNSIITAHGWGMTIGTVQ